MRLITDKAMSTERRSICNFTLVESCKFQVANDGGKVRNLMRILFMRCLHIPSKNLNVATGLLVPISCHIFSKPSKRR